MKTYLIAYTLAMTPGRNPHLFPLAIQWKVDPYAKEFSPCTWIVRTNVDEEGVLNLLRGAIVPGDKVTVIHLPPGTKFAADGLTPDEKQRFRIDP